MRRIKPLTHTSSTVALLHEAGQVHGGAPASIGTELGTRSVHGFGQHVGDEAVDDLRKEGAVDRGARP